MRTGLAAPARQVALHPEPALGEIEEFLTGARSPVGPDRSLATVLFPDTW